MSVVGTLIVNFGESAASQSGSIIAEWDDTRNLNNEGEVKTQFVPGDEVFLLVHTDANTSVVDVKSTAGSVGLVGDVQLPRSQDIGWGDNLDEQRLTYNPTGILNYKWFGRVGVGPIQTGKIITISNSFPCLATVSYHVNFARYRLQTPAMVLAEKEQFPLRAYIYYLVSK